MNKKVAIVGVQGIPAKYGGFESLAEYLVRYLNKRFDITVYCSSRIYPHKDESYSGAKLKYLPLSANGYQSVIYDFISIILSVHKNDKVLVLGASAGIFMPLFFLYRKKIILNFGGLDWRRNKWGYLVKKYLRLSEKYAVQSSGLVVSDNQGIKEYIDDVYGVDSVLIEYGGDQVKPQGVSSSDKNKYPFLGQKYALNVARIQPDNNVEIIIKSFLELDQINLVVIGNWESSEYGRNLKTKYSTRKHIFLLDAIHDQCLLDKIRSNCYIYVHGHSAGGTNPALVEAMSLSLPIIAYSSGFNEYTTENQAIYFSDDKHLLSILREKNAVDYKSVSEKMHEIALRRYRWSDIVSKYEKCLVND